MEESARTPTQSNRSNEKFERRIKTQTGLPSAEAVPSGVWLELKVA